MIRSALTAAALGLAVASSAGAAADLLLRGGVVYLGPGRRAQAIAVSGGAIVAVGSDHELAAQVGDATEVVDLAGAMVVPGFHDSHVHPIAGGLQALACPLDGARSVAAILDTVRACATARPGSGDTWLVGGGWDLSLFPEANPSRSLLDGVVPERPVLLIGADGHSAWVNSRALVLAGIERSTPDPPGGVIERDAAGAPSGTLREDAVELVRALVPEPSDADRRAALRHALARAAEAGVTSVIDALATPEDYRAYLAADAAGELTVHVLACALASGRSEGETGPAGELAASGEAALRALRAVGASPTGRVETGCIKAFVDGVLEGETAALLEPYLDGDGSHRGKLALDSDELALAVTRWDAAGLQVHFHAIGDRAVRTALDAVAAARRDHGPRDHRHHVTHLQLVDRAEHPRFAALDVTATFQALWAWPDPYIEDVNLPQVGPDRVARMYPIASLRREGARIAGASDWPVSSLAPLYAIEVALTRQDPDGGDPDVLNPGERVDLDTMLAAYTTAGAWLERREHRSGAVAPGMDADLVVLERDLFAVPPAAIGEVRVLRTIVGGRTVFAAAP